MIPQVRIVPRETRRMAFQYFKEGLPVEDWSLYPSPKQPDARREI